jgi:PAS domain S-box-containing protein
VYFRGQEMRASPHTRFKAQAPHRIDRRPPAAVRPMSYDLALSVPQSELERRLRQQAAVAALGQQALACRDLDVLLRQAVTTVAEVLEVELCKVLELLPERSELRMREGIGWKPGTAARATLRTDRSSQAGYTLMMDAPVVVEDLGSEKRFNGPALLHEHGVVSGVSVVIRGRERPFGVLGVHTKEHRVFTREDVHFLEAIANVLAQALERAGAEQALRRAHEELERRVAERTHALTETNARLTRAIQEHEETAAQMRKLSRALEQTADFVMVTDVAGRIEYVNPAFEQLTGYTREEALGKTPRLVRSGMHTSDFYRRFWETILRGEVYRGVFINRTREGRIFHEEKTITPLKDAEGVITHFISTGRDITERRQAEEQARRHQAELAHVARLSTMGEMASGLAHELNQPLAAITNYSQGCIRRLHGGRATPESLQEALEQVCAQAQRASEIIRRLRNFVRKGEPQRSIVDANVLVREVLALMEPDLRRHQVRLQLELADDLPRVLADPIQVEQVILNLLLNGAEAMSSVAPEQRTLTIRTERAGGDFVAVYVADTGPGLPAEVGEQIFDPFFTTKPTGMGMGLSISRSIVEAHGGALAVLPTPAGARFRLTLPTPEDDEPNAA